MIPWLEPGDPFPPVEQALTEPNGLLAAGEELTIPRLLDAYSRGIFPWFNDEDPVLWWSPDPRMVLYTDEARVSRSLRKTARSRRFRLTCDEVFLQVMRECAAPRPGQEGTWITPAMLDAYVRLAALGHAHSIEVWEGEALVGGLYGVSLGRMFYGESMFARRSDASKVALVVLARQLHRWGMPVIDCQTSTAHLASMGARQVRRAEFVTMVARLVTLAPPADRWKLDADLPAAV
jgi:leucyl/phenylalanyl-tRNA--protein transferase